MYIVSSLLTKINSIQCFYCLDTRTALLYTRLNFQFAHKFSMVKAHLRNVSPERRSHRSLYRKRQIVAAAQTTNSSNQIHHHRRHRPTTWCAERCDINSLVLDEYRARISSLLPPCPPKMDDNPNELSLAKKQRPRLPTFGRYLTVLLCVVLFEFWGWHFILYILYIRNATNEFFERKSTALFSWRGCWTALFRRAILLNVFIQRTTHLLILISLNYQI